MKELLITAGMLMGILLCVTGLAMVLVTQLDPLYGSMGLLGALSGGVLVWFCRGTPPQKGLDDQAMALRERSAPPPSPSSDSKRTHPNPNRRY